MLSHIHLCAIHDPPLRNKRRDRCQSALANSIESTTNTGSYGRQPLTGHCIYPKRHVFDDMILAVMPSGPQIY